MCVCIVSFSVDLGGTVNMRTKLGMFHCPTRPYSVDSNCKMCWKEFSKNCRHVLKWFLTIPKSEASYNWRELTHNNLFWKKKHIESCSQWKKIIYNNSSWKTCVSTPFSNDQQWVYLQIIQEYWANYLPSWELAYPMKSHFWRWFSFSQGRIC